VGDVINLMNGTSTPLLQKVKGCIDNDFSEVKLPVVSCDGTSQASAVMGFAHFELASVQTAGGRRGVTMHGVMQGNEGPGGGGSYGVGVVTLVE
jgi:hypothetical protein